MKRQFQVEYMSRPDERGHVEVLSDYRSAFLRAKDMSDKHDGHAVMTIVDLDDRDVANIVGEIEFMFGIEQERTGVMRSLATPHQKQ